VTTLDDFQSISDLIQHAGPGFGRVVASPGQVARLTAVLAKRTGIEVIEPDDDRLQNAVGPLLVRGLPSPSVLAELNGRRGLLSRAGAQRVFVLELRQVAPFREHAADIDSALVLDERAPWVPGSERRGALAEYKRWVRQRFGRLDLRGFVRSEQEDVSWKVEEIYQELMARPASIASASDFDESAELDQAVVRQLLDSQDVPATLLADWIRGWLDEAERPAVLLGGPGTGKTFFLRWLAQRSLDGRTKLSGRVPVMAALSGWVRSGGRDGLFEFLRDGLSGHGLSIADGLEQRARQGKLLFLLDGLDEGGDDGTRRRIGAAVQGLADRFPSCPVLVTSRTTGYQRTLESAWELRLEPFDDDAVGAFLKRWMRLYTRDRLGRGEQAVRVGREEGERLAADVLAHQQVMQLARTPLLLTVIALVHRAGVRLPDHRVELYERASQILVERWNRVRSLETDGRAPLIKTADAARLLGPVALALIARDERSSIDEGSLLTTLRRVMRRSSPPGVDSPEQALALFRDQLGLLVEQGPGLYAFLHLTLAEYFAAWELVRTGELEEFVRSREKVLDSRWQEVVLLAAGILGVLRADDVRLDRLVERLVETVCGGEEVADVEGALLLGHLFADDLGLAAATGGLVLRTVLPRLMLPRPWAVALDEGDQIRPIYRLLLRLAASRHRPVVRAVAQAAVDSFDGWEVEPSARSVLPGFMPLGAVELDVDPQAFVRWAVADAPPDGLPWFMAEPSWSRAGGLLTSTVPRFLLRLPADFRAGIEVRDYLQPTHLSCPLTEWSAVDGEGQAHWVSIRHGERGLPPNGVALIGYRLPGPLPAID